MVYGFIIHTVGSGGPPCRVLYQRLFSCGVRDDQQRTDGDYLEKENVRRKEEMAAVARLVASRCLLRRQISARPTADSEEMAAPPEEEEVGVLGLPLGGPFLQEKVVLWVGGPLFCFSLICDPHENLTLAEMTLRTMVKYLLETLRLVPNSSHAVLCADKMELVLDAFFPQGALLFLSHAAVQALERELSGGMTA